MKIGYILAIVPAGAALSGSICCADTLQTHRIPAQLAVEAASETVSDARSRATAKRPLCSMQTAQRS
jgi:threonine/homoserine efflux transporter RhtA